MYCKTRNKGKTDKENSHYLVKQKKERKERMRDHNNKNKKKNLFIINEIALARNRARNKDTGGN